MDKIIEKYSWTNSSNDMHSIYSERDIFTKLYHRFIYLSLSVKKDDLASVIFP